MKRFKFIFIIFLLGIILVLSSNLVSADFGPKPLAYIEVTGLESDYYFDLLVHYDNDVPTLSDDEVDLKTSIYYYDDDFPGILNGYQDEDGFASYSLYTDMPRSIRETDEQNVFQIGYFLPPNEFKIAIVTESNNILVSDLVTRTFFYAYFVFDLSNDTIIETETDVTGGVFTDVGGASQRFPFGDIILYVFLGLMLTLFLEVGLLYLIGYRKIHTFKIVTITNIITQVLLNIFLWLAFYMWYGIWAYIFVLLIGEIFVFVTEIKVYKKLFKEENSINPKVYAIIANTLSFICGFAIMGLLGF